MSSASSHSRPVPSTRTRPPTGPGSTPGGIKRFSGSCSSPRNSLRVGAVPIGKAADTTPRHSISRAALSRSAIAGSATADAGAHAAITTLSHAAPGSISVSETLLLMTMTLAARTDNPRYCKRRAEVTSGFLPDLTRYVFS